MSIFSNCAASHVSPEAIRSSLETILRGVVENHTWTETEHMGWDLSIGPARPLYELAAASLVARKPAAGPPPSPCPAAAAAGSRVLAFQGTIEVRALPLADRYGNSLRWHKWLFDRGADVCRPPRGLWRWHPFWPDHWARPRPHRRYWACQALAWLFVLFPCLCAALLATPPFLGPRLALGCRSLNHLLYAVLALAAASLRVLVSAGGGPINPHGPHSRRSSSSSASSRNSRRWRRVARWAYTALVWFNAVGVLMGGTVLQLVGAYDTCRCAAGLFDRQAGAGSNQGRAAVYTERIGEVRQARAVQCSRSD